VVRLQVLPKKQACTMQVAFHRLAGTSETLSDFMDRQLLYVAQKHDLSVVIRYTHSNLRIQLANIGWQEIHSSPRTG
jgi:hypothetical protein